MKYQIAPQVVAFSTERAGGVSEGAYTSFNANAFCGDNPAHVTENRARLCASLQIEASHLIIPHQTHDTRLLVADAAFVKKPEEQRGLALEGIDAVATAERGVCVCVSTADCIPVLLYDERRQVVAAIHAGWRGSRERIVYQVMQQLHEAFGTQGEDVHAVICPGISLASFEVGDEVYEAFRSEGFDMSRIAQRYPTQTGGEKWYIDLWECNRLQLLDAGVGEARIEVAGICTYQNPHRFFSARRLGIQSGRILNGILLA